MIFCRRALAADLDGVAALDKIPGRREVIAQAIAAGTCTAALLEGELAGYAVLDYHFFDCAFIELVVVGEAFRRRGVGRALLACCRRNAATPKLFTSTNESNAPMRALLGRAGFRRCGSADALDEGDPELFYVREDAGDLLEGHSCAVRTAAGGLLFFSEPGLGPPLRLLREMPEQLAGAQVADRVAGKAAALLWAHAGAGSLWAARMSEPAAAFLRRAGVAFAYGELVPMILNRAGDGPCPMEARALPLEDPAEAFALFSALIKPQPAARQ